MRSDMATVGVVAGESWRLRNWERLVSLVDRVGGLVWEVWL